MNLKDKLTLKDERDQADIKAIKRDFSHMLRSPLSWWMAGLSVGAFILLWLLNGTAETLGISPDLARDLGLVIVLVMIVLVAAAVFFDLAPSFVTRSEIRFLTRPGNDLYEDKLRYEEQPILPPILTRVRRVRIEDQGSK
ncbi:hypothetical protein F9K94_22825 [Brucella tritici]|jgi:hypothetical protein|uniref:Uncharacterized protein n=1 Tax=Brucella tritici TaxID=94626 RepID=A0A7V7VQU3_9HYPH|nr:hypothetical protein [Brucella tritici]KAB2654897.1 hypothetical protein F9K94_22825 [Brucella tritici]